MERRDKKCKQCGVVKELSEFYPKKKSVGGVDSRCKKCVLQSKKRKYQKKKLLKNNPFYLIEDNKTEISEDIVLYFIETLNG